jgi:hypothetical protein
LRWTWDPAKNDANLRKHNIDFPTAIAVFDDPMSITVEDHYRQEQRWRTTGMVASQVIVVIHTWFEETTEGQEPSARVISARKASRLERREYEEGNE